MPTVPVAPMKILLADDNIDLVEVLKSFLEMQGHHVIIASDGVRALELAKQERPDLAVVDIGMPRMSGYEVAQAIRREEWGRRMALIASTGWGANEDQRRTKLAGFDLHLTKPFDIDKLGDALQKITLQRT